MVLCCMALMALLCVASMVNDGTAHSFDGTALYRFDALLRIACCGLRVAYSFDALLRIACCVLL
jgi:hypothetical protein